MRKLIPFLLLVLLISLSHSQAGATGKHENEPLAKVATVILKGQHASNYFLLSHQDREYLKKQGAELGDKNSISVKDRGAGGLELLAEKDRFLIKVVDAEKQTLTINGRVVQIDKSRSLEENMKRLGAALQTSSALENLILPRAYAGVPIAVWAAYIIGSQAICVYRLRHAPELSGLCLAAPIGYPIKLLLSIGGLNAKEFNAMSPAEKEASFVLTELNCPAHVGGILKLQVRSLSGETIEIQEESFVNPENPRIQRKVTVRNATQRQNFSAELDSNRQPQRDYPVKVPWIEDIKSYIEICQDKEKTKETMNQATKNRAQLESFSSRPQATTLPAIR